ncbi:M16 family metallopeptidase [Sphingomonas sp. GlSt437]|uniref:M16 family metallopeptidase n=1 Tax=Sphingomonas sp. GlSt437 TaxID=3389970 RepID=UPI003A885168
MFALPRAAAYPVIATAFALLLVPTGQGWAAPSKSSAGHGAPKTVPAAAATPAAVDRSPWLYNGSDIPQDPDWHFGTLPNGLRYAVRRNGVPPGQVAVRVRVDAGSLYETESERGFAHFIEHLTFRGSAYVPDGEAKRVWQRMGTTFGSDTNAQTTPTQTFFKLDLPSATESGLDESLHIMSGMMESPAITPQAVTAERPVVLAEQREAPGAQVRFGDAVRATFFAGQPLADRSPIGNIKTLEAATAETVKAFHDHWYRPERTVVIVSGDIDPAVAEQLVIKNFSGWVRNDPKPADPDFGKPDPSQPATRVIVEPSIPTLITWAVLRPWQFNNDTIIFNQKRLVDQVALRVINRRLESRARSGGSFLQASVQLNDEARSANGTFVDVVPAGDDWEKAVKDVRAVIADAAAAPATQAEIDRELAELDAAMKNQVATQAAEAGAKQADDLIEALDIRETVTTAQGSYDVLAAAEKAGMFNPDAILASTRRVFVGTATHAVINLHAPDATAGQRLAAVLSADVSGLAGARKALTKVDFSKLPPLGAPGTVTSREKLGDFGSEKVVFSNGVRMIVFPSSSETGRVYVRVRCVRRQRQWHRFEVVN